MDELLNTDNLQKVLEEYAVAVRNLYQDRLILHDRIASGKLLNDIRAHVEYDGQTYEVQLDLWNYWRYIEMDTEPHWPPPSAILKWITVKPVIPRPDAKGRIPSPKSLAYLIGRKISEEGTEGSHDFENAKQVVVQRFRERIAEAVGHDFENYIRKVVTG